MTLKDAYRHLSTRRVSKDTKTRDALEIALQLMLAEIGQRALVEGKDYKNLRGA